MNTAVGSAGLGQPDRYTARSPGTQPGRVVEIPGSPPRHRSAAAWTAPPRPGADRRPEQIGFPRDVKTQIEQDPVTAVADQHLRLYPDDADSAPELKVGHADSPST